MKAIESKRDIIRITKGNIERTEDTIVTEYPVTVKINGQEFVTMVCTPEYIEDMVIGYLAENSHGRFSNAVKDAANSAKQLGADAVLVESHGKSFEPIGALTNATIMPSFCLLMAKESLPQFVAPCAD